MAAAPLILKHKIATGILSARDAPTSSANPTPGVDGKLSTSVKALTGFFVVVVIVAIALLAWRIHVWRKRKAQKAAESRTNVSTVEKGFYDEKNAFDVSFDSDFTDIKAPSKATLLPPVPSTPGVGWVPQVKTILLPSGEIAPVPSAMTAPTRAPKNNEGSRDGHSPPPTYRVATSGFRVPPPPPPPASNLPDVPPPTPPATRRTSPKPSSRRTSPPPSIVIPPPRTPRETFDLPPIPSPRSASIPNKTHSSQSARIIPKTASMLSTKNLPRLMDVATAFTPARDDELPIRVGEVLRLLEEFEDEWCLVQRVGVANEKGVIPRFC
ncbi:hypothetical protein EWM64_g7239, partial [Hericium alpestre]